MSVTEIQETLKVLAAIGGVASAIIGVAKYISDRREKEVREWQKVVLYKILSQNEPNAIGFTTLLEKYRIEAQSIQDFDLKKKEVSEDSLRRVLLELVSANIAQLEPAISFRLKVTQQKIDQQELNFRFNTELAKVIGPSPYTFTIDEVAKEIAPKFGLDIQLVRNTIRMSVEMELLEVDDHGKLAFPR